MEIERKFIVDIENWQNIAKGKGERIIQGYLYSSIDKTIRVRVMGDNGFITIKGKTVNISREEYEYPIPANEAAEIINKLADGVIEKKRYTITYKSKTWEVDEFLGDNEGLIVAEIELDSEGEQFELPQWVGKEVSDDARYYNSNLLKSPFKLWKK
ncbi:MAG TPA: CYTH domain-containing protein [Bacteroidales bacterium]|nr:CYTH domain-containing protein [Bacteroidales bacterium]